MRSGLVAALAMALTERTGTSTYYGDSYSLGSVGKPKSKDTKAKRKMRKASQRKNRK